MGQARTAAPADTTIDDDDGLCVVASVAGTLQGRAVTVVPPTRVQVRRAKQSARRTAPAPAGPLRRSTSDGCASSSHSTVRGRIFRRA